MEKNISCFTDIMSMSISKPLTLENIFDFVCDVGIVDSALFNMQTVGSCDVTIKMFFYHGCGDMVFKRLLSRYWLVWDRLD